jgi:hypothetical protein
MSILVYNDNNETVLDAMLPHATLALTGSVTPTTANANLSFNFPSSVSNPIFYVRQRNLNQALYILGVSATGISYRATTTGIFDYRVYSVDPTLAPNDPFGLQVFNSTGGVLYRSSFNNADIRQRSLILSAGQNGTATTNFNTTFAASDGGRPFMLGNPFHICYGAPSGPNQQGIIFSVGFLWLSATEFQVGSAIVSGGPPTEALLGYRPRYVYLIR